MRIQIKQQHTPPLLGAQASQGNRSRGFANTTFLIRNGPGQQASIPLNCNEKINITVEMSVFCPRLQDHTLQSGGQVAMVKQRRSTANEILSPPQTRQ
jgi:hypothetical protein